MKPDIEELWCALEHLIDQWTQFGGMQAQIDIAKFLEKNCSNGEFLDFAYKQIMECWRLGSVKDADMRYQVLWEMLMHERRWRKVEFLKREDLAIWVREQWNNLLQSRLSIRRSNFKDGDRYNCVVAFKQSLSLQLILCLSQISTETALKQLEEMRMVCLDSDIKDIEHYAAELKDRVAQRKTSKS